MSTVLNIGITCPQCASPETSVMDSRPWAGWVKRRRKCSVCDHRWSTLEVHSSLVETLPGLLSIAAEASNSLTRLVKGLHTVVTSEIAANVAAQDAREN